VDFLLRFLLDRSAGSPAQVTARLDSIERTLADLTKQWRMIGPIAPARELRLSSETLAGLLAWLEAPDDASDADVARLGVYASGALTDDSVPAGWLRVTFG